MELLGLAVVAADGTIKHASEGMEEVTLSWRGAYEPGDRLVVTTASAGLHLTMKLDECLAESWVYLPGTSFEFPIPMGDDKKMYGKDRAFTDERHWAFVRALDPRERGNWHNLALNAHDRKIDDAGDVKPSLYPHASTNVVCDNPQFYARNAIDGIFEAKGHGSWPHESWGVNRQENAWLRVDFGEPVLADELRLYLRADYPHDSWWEDVRVELSNGEDLTFTLDKTGAAQLLGLGGAEIEWLRIYHLRRSKEPGFPAISQVQVWGRYAEAPAH